MSSLGELLGLLNTPLKDCLSFCFIVMPGEHHSKHLFLKCYIFFFIAYFFYLFLLLSMLIHNTLIKIVADLVFT